MTKEELMKLQTYKLFEDEETVYVDRNDVLDLLDQEPCEDAISRADAVKVASGYCHPANIAGELAKLPPVTPTQRWIPVTERLPEKGKLILLCFRSAKDTPHWRIQVGYLGSHDVDDCYFEKIGVVPVWYTVRFYWSLDKVVAWMPLPKPYESQESEGTDAGSN